LIDFTYSVWLTIYKYNFVLIVNSISVSIANLI